MSYHSLPCGAFTARCPNTTRDITRPFALSISFSLFLLVEGVATKDSLFASCGICEGRCRYRFGRVRTSVGIVFDNIIVSVN